MKWVYDDGGRSKYFAASKVSDCVTRAIAIATRCDYYDTYKAIGNIIGYTPRNGVLKNDVKKIMKHFGGEWHSCMSIGSGCKVHLSDGEIPMKGTIIANVSKHVVAIIDGVVHDTHDPSRHGNRCVYGYWVFN